MKKLTLLALTTATFLLAACGNTQSKQETKSEAHYPLTIENVTKAEGGSKWTKKEET